jgi:hypothetical protein
MPLWGNKDNAANSDIAALMQVSAHVDTANQAVLFENVTAGAIGPHLNANLIIGQFAVDTNEIQAAQAAGTAHPSHSGWVLRKEGTGGRAGRVTYETLVATGSIATDNSDDTWFPDYALTISTQPTSNNATSMKDLTFTVAGASTPSGATLRYQWQRYITGNTTWVNVVDQAGYYSGNASATFTANNYNANGTSFRAVVSATGANSVTSTAAVISLHP